MHGEKKADKIFLSFRVEGRNETLFFSFKLQDRDSVPYRVGAHKTSFWNKLPPTPPNPHPQPNFLYLQRYVTSCKKSPIFLSLCAFRSYVFRAVNQKRQNFVMGKSLESRVCLELYLAYCLTSKKRWILISYFYSSLSVKQQIFIVQ